MNLNNPKENSITYEDFYNSKIALISDEAHHINSETKKGSKKLNHDELFEVMSWERTVEKIFKANADNVLLEFTATIDFQDDYLSKKYSPKIIFDYPLMNIHILLKYNNKQNLYVLHQHYNVYISYIFYLIQ